MTMSEMIIAENERSAADAFSAQSLIFDEYSASNTIIQYKRARVREHVEQYLPSGSSILELNAGTGEDALYFAGKGHRVHATDIAEGMLKILGEKVDRAASGRVTKELCSFTSLDRLGNKGPYDLIFSDFAGLNCTDELDRVLRSCTNLLKPGGLLTLVLLPRFCCWETLLLFKGKWKTAFRRFSGSKGARSHVEGYYFRCWYYNPSYVKAALQDSFETVGLEGLCTLVPPSYIEGFAEKHPRLYAFLCRREARLKSRWPWNSIGDYYIITLRKKSSS
jgi:ubiquinone/menaquinone biosynthesis C-methylase UbiE